LDLPSFWKSIILEIHHSKNIPSIKETFNLNNKLKEEMYKLRKEIAILHEKLKELQKKD
jgi:peptidoglycan hydrolase CwlO-like protein